MCWGKDLDTYKSKHIKIFPPTVTSTWNSVKMFWEVLTFLRFLSYRNFSLPSWDHIDQIESLFTRDYLKTLFFPPLEYCSILDKHPTTQSVTYNTMVCAPLFTGMVDSLPVFGYALCGLFLREMSLGCWSLLWTGENRCIWEFIAYPQGFWPRNHRWEVWKPSSATKLSQFWTTLRCLTWELPCRARLNWGLNYPLLSFLSLPVLLPGNLPHPSSQIPSLINHFHISPHFRICFLVT